MLRFLPTVRIRRFRAPLGTIFDVASEWSVLARVDVEINAVDDGTHGRHTLHGHSLAVDLDTVNDHDNDLESLFHHLRVQLPSGYDVVHEGDHVHVEWDVHRAPMRRPAPPAAPAI